MENRFLVILEVSQKQAYIFSSNKLRENVARSAQIAYVTSAEFFEKTAGAQGLFTKEQNYVFAGGGHTVLEFATEGAAKQFNKVLTRRIHCDYPDMELFATIVEYDEKMSPGDNLLALTRKLEEKKSIRSASFRLGSFGIERIDANTLEPKEILTAEEERIRTQVPRSEEVLDWRLVADGYKPSYQFENLGISKGDSSYIAIVHIDGNGMGKRVARFYKNHEKDDWNHFKTVVREFSESIDNDFKAAYKDMTEEVAAQIRAGVLSGLSLSGENAFPVRRVITSGDDICFVSEGRIGIEVAAAFVRALVKRKNEQDEQGYAACAGVAIVHQKYPFFKAYELAEALCSNAKRFGADLSSRAGLTDDGSSVSSIDWHIEQGEIRDTLEETRSVYRTADGGYLNLRPYIIEAPAKVMDVESIRRYEKFYRLMKFVQKKGDDNIRSSLKEMRTHLKKGKEAVDYYIRFHKLQDIALNAYQDIFTALSYEKVGSGEGLECRLFITTSDGKERTLIYDAIESMDLYIPFEKTGGTVA